MKVKVCGNMDLEATKTLSELPLDYLGFIFVPSSKRALSVDDALPLVGSVGSNVATVGVFQDETLSKVVDVVNRLSLQNVQLHGEEDVEYISELRGGINSGVEIWKVIAISDSEDMKSCEQYEEVVDRFLFDTKCAGGQEGSTEASGGTGNKFSWEVLAEYKGSKPYLLAGGIAPRDAALLNEVKKLQPFLCGVDLNSKFEIEPGKKNTEQVAEFIKAL